MENTFLPFSKPSISEEAIQEVVACLRSGWLTTGPRVQQFTQALTNYLKAPYVLPLAHATAGLHLSLLALHLKPGDEVVTTPLTFAATLNTIVLANAVPVLVDVDPTTFNIDVGKIEEVITDRTRVIMPVHYTGLPVDLDPLNQLADRYHLRVIEDAAHAIGTRYKNKLIGSFGDIQVFSFHPNKNMTTGEGGCVTTGDDAIAKEISLLRFHGIDREAWNRYGKTGNQHYQIAKPGFKYNMMDLQAALGIHQLAALEGFIEKRTRLAHRYLEKMSDWSELTLPQKANYDYKHAWHLFTPLINPKEAGMDRNTFMELMQENNIGTGLHYESVHLSPFYQNTFGFKTGDFPIAEDIANRIVSLPLFPDMTEHEQDRVINTMFKLFRKK